MVEVQNTIIKRRKFGTRLSKGHGLEHVVIFGAGVSRSCDIPLAKNLLEEIVKFVDPRSIDIVMDFLEYVYPRFKRGEVWCPLAEDVLGMLDIAESYCSIRGRSRGYRWREGAIKQVRDRFLRSLGNYLWSFQQVQMDEYHPLRRFVRLLSKQVVYITFNYDLTLETALSLENIPYSYGIPYPASGVSIIKPHGSINWFYKTQNFPGQESSSWFDLGSTIVCYSLLQLTRGWAERPPAIIPPSPVKKIEAFEIKRMWTSFSSVTHSTNSLAIVGYSLPPADRLSRLILRRSVLVPKQRTIHVVDPNSAIEKVYRENLCDTFQFLSRKFENWVQILEDMD